MSHHGFQNLVAALPSFVRVLVRGIKIRRANQTCQQCSFPGGEVAWFFTLTQEGKAERQSQAAAKRIKLRHYPVRGSLNNSSPRSWRTLLQRRLQPRCTPRGEHRAHTSVQIHRAKVWECCAKLIKIASRD